MIIDLVETMSDEDRAYFEHAYERYHLYEFHRPIHGDLYERYPSAPYLGEGGCAIHNNCKECEHYRGHYGDYCEEYEDADYGDWFERLGPDLDERAFIEALQKKEQTIYSNFIHSEDWRLVVCLTGTPIELNVPMLQWCNDNDIEYCIYRRMNNDSYFFLKCKTFPVVFRAKFTPSDIHVGDLTELKENGWTVLTIEYEGIAERYNEITKWIEDNTAEYTFIISGDVLLFESKEDAIHYKMVWV